MDRSCFFIFLPHPTTFTTPKHSTHPKKYINFPALADPTLFPSPEWRRLEDLHRVLSGLSTMDVVLVCSLCPELETGLWTRLGLSLSRVSALLRWFDGLDQNKDDLEGDVGLVEERRRLTKRELSIACACLECLGECWRGGMSARCVRSVVRLSESFSSLSEEQLRRFLGLGGAAIPWLAREVDPDADLRVSILGGEQEEEKAEERRRSRKKIDGLLVGEEEEDGEEGEWWRRWPSRTTGALLDGGVSKLPLESACLRALVKASRASSARRDGVPVCVVLDGNSRLELAGDEPLQLYGPGLHVLLLCRASVGSLRGRRSEVLRIRVRAGAMLGVWLEPGGVFVGCGGSVGECEEHAVRFSAVGMREGNWACLQISLTPRMMGFGVDARVVVNGGEATPNGALTMPRELVGDGDNGAVHELVVGKDLVGGVAGLALAGDRFATATTDTWNRAATSGGIEGKTALTIGPGLASQPKLVACWTPYFAVPSRPKQPESPTSTTSASDPVSHLQKFRNAQTWNVQRGDAPVWALDGGYALIHGDVDAAECSTEARKWWETEWGAAAEASERRGGPRVPLSTAAVERRVRLRAAQFALDTQERETQDILSHLQNPLVEQSPTSKTLEQSPTSKTLEQSPTSKTLEQSPTSNHTPSSSLSWNDCSSRVDGFFAQTARVLAGMDLMAATTDFDTAAPRRISETAPPKLESKLGLCAGTRLQLVGGGAVWRDQDFGQNFLAAFDGSWAGVGVWLTALCARVEEKKDDEENILRGGGNTQKDEEGDISRGGTTTQKDEDGDILRGGTTTQKDEQNILRGRTTTKKDEEKGESTEKDVSELWRCCAGSLSDDGDGAAMLLSLTAACVRRNPGVAREAVRGSFLPLAGAVASKRGGVGVALATLEWLQAARETMPSLEAQVWRYLALDWGSFASGRYGAAVGEVLVRTAAGAAAHRPDLVRRLWGGPGVVLDAASLFALRFASAHGLLRRSAGGHLRLDGSAAETGVVTQLLRIASAAALACAGLGSSCADAGGQLGGTRTGLVGLDVTGVLGKMDLPCPLWWVRSRGVSGWDEVGQSCPSWIREETTTTVPQKLYFVATDALCPPRDVVPERIDYGDDVFSNEWCLLRSHIRALLQAAAGASLPETRAAVTCALATAVDHSKPVLTAADAVVAGAAGLAGPRRPQSLRFRPPRESAGTPAASAVAALGLVPTADFGDLCGSVDAEADGMGVGIATFALFGLIGAAEDESEIVAAAALRLAVSAIRKTVPSRAPKVNTAASTALREARRRMSSLWSMSSPISSPSPTSPTSSAVLSSPSAVSGALQRSTVPSSTAEWARRLESSGGFELFFALLSAGNVGEPVYDALLEMAFAGDSPPPPSAKVLDASRPLLNPAAAGTILRLLPKMRLGCAERCVTDLGLLANLSPTAAASIASGARGWVPSLVEFLGRVRNRQSHEETDQSSEASEDFEGQDHKDFEGQDHKDFEKQDHKELEAQPPQDIDAKPPQDIDAKPPKEKSSAPAVEATGPEVSRGLARVTERAFEALLVAALRTVDGWTALQPIRAMRSEFPYAAAASWCSLRAVVQIGEEAIAKPDDTRLDGLIHAAALAEADVWGSSGRTMSSLAWKPVRSMAAKVLELWVAFLSRHSRAVDIAATEPTGLSFSGPLVVILLGIVVWRMEHAERLSESLTAALSATTRLVSWLVSAATRREEEEKALEEGEEDVTMVEDEEDGESSAKSASSVDDLRNPMGATRELSMTAAKRWALALRYSLRSLQSRVPSVDATLVAGVVDCLSWAGDSEVEEDEGSFAAVCAGVSKAATDADALATEQFHAHLLSKHEGAQYASGQGVWSRAADAGPRALLRLSRSELGRGALQAARAAELEAAVVQWMQRAQRGTMAPGAIWGTGLLGDEGVPKLSRVEDADQARLKISFSRWKHTHGSHSYHQTTRGPEPSPSAPVLPSGVRFLPDAPAPEVVDVDDTGEDAHVIPHGMREEDEDDRLSHTTDSSDDSTLEDVYGESSSRKIEDSKSSAGRQSRRSRVDTPESIHTTSVRDGDVSGNVSDDAATPFQIASKLRDRFGEDEDESESRHHPNKSKPASDHGKKDKSKTPDSSSDGPSIPHSLSLPSLEHAPEVVPARSEPLTVAPRRLQSTSAAASASVAAVGLLSAISRPLLSLYYPPTDTVIGTECGSRGWHLFWARSSSRRGPTGAPVAPLAAAVGGDGLLLAMRATLVTVRGQEPGTLRLTRSALFFEPDSVVPEWPGRGPRLRGAPSPDHPESFGGSGGGRGGLDASGSRTDGGGRRRAATSLSDPLLEPISFESPAEGKLHVPMYRVRGRARSSVSVSPPPSFGQHKDSSMPKSSASYEDLSNPAASAALAPSSSVSNDLKVLRPAEDTIVEVATPKARRPSSAPDSTSRQRSKPASIRGPSKSFPRGPRRWPLRAVQRVFARRWLLARTAVEIFLKDGSSIFLALESPTGASVTAAARALIATLHALKLPRLRRPPGLRALRVRWQRHELSNLGYLMALNTLSGRTFLDSAQYPVLPWTLAAFDAEPLDLTAESTFRDLSKPVGAIGESRLAELRERFKAFDDGPGGMPAFLYGSLYSSAGTVAGFLLRCEPFATAAADLQGGRFDVPDRVFRSMPAAYRSVTTAPSDFRELPPELVTNPAVLINGARLPLGWLQSEDGDKRWVDDVELPPWSGGDPHRFIWVARRVLESEEVSRHLHEWIDLIFGYRQRGEPAKEANNVYPQFAYEGAVDLGALQPAERAATEAQIANFGQVPLQLFTEPHPARLPAEEALVPFASRLALPPVECEGRSLLPPPDSTRPLASLLIVPVCAAPSTSTPAGRALMSLFGAGRDSGEEPSVHLLGGSGKGQDAEGWESGRSRAVWADDADRDVTLIPQRALTLDGDGGGAQWASADEHDLLDMGHPVVLLVAQKRDSLTAVHWPSKSGPASATHKWSPIPSVDDSRPIDFRSSRPRPLPGSPLGDPWSATGDTGAAHIARTTSTVLVGDDDAVGLLLSVGHADGALRWHALDGSLAGECPSSQLGGDAVAVAARDGGVVCVGLACGSVKQLRLARTELTSRSALVRTGIGAAIGGLPGAGGWGRAGLASRPPVSASDPPVLAAPRTPALDREPLVGMLHSRDTVPRSVPLAPLVLPGTDSPAAPSVAACPDNTSSGALATAAKLSDTGADLLADAGATAIATAPLFPASPMHGSPASKGHLDPAHIWHSCRAASSTIEQPALAWPAHGDSCPALGSRRALSHLDRVREAVLLVQSRLLHDVNAATLPTLSLLRTASVHGSPWRRLAGDELVPSVRRSVAVHLDAVVPTTSRSPVSALGIHPDRTSVLVGHHDGSLALVDLTKHRPVRCLHHDHVRAHIRRDANLPPVQANGTRSVRSAVLLASSRGVAAWDPPTNEPTAGSLLASIDPNGKLLAAVATRVPVSADLLGSIDGELVVVGDIAGRISFRSSFDLSLLRCLTVPPPPMPSSRPSPKSIASPAGKGIPHHRFWAYKDAPIPPEPPVTSLVFADRGRTLFAGDALGRIHAIVDPVSIRQAVQKRLKDSFFSLV